MSQPQQLSPLNPDDIDGILHGVPQQGRSSSLPRRRQLRRSVRVGRPSDSESESESENEPSPEQPVFSASDTTPQRPSLSRSRSAPAPSQRSSSLLEVPSLSSIFSYVSSFIDSEPAIIEYSATQIADRTSIRIKAEWTQCDSLDEAKKMIRLVALMKSGDGPVETKEIVGRPKRVKELLRKAGMAHLMEDVHKKEIFKAMRKLKLAGEQRVESAGTPQ